jgi:membrane-associated phospholipid phosphatase
MSSVSVRVAAAIAAAAVACYALLWVGWAHHWGWLAAIDTAALAPLHDFGVKHPAWVRFWDVLCVVFAPNSFKLPGLVLVVMAALRRNVRAAVFLLATIGLSGVVTDVFKHLANRPRPPTALVGAASTSFPSGHALGLMVAVLALLAVTAGSVSNCARVISLVVGAALVIAIGAARVVLNVHNPSDVVAGWALGYLWFFLCWFVIRPQLNAEAADRTPAVPGTDH